jgi:hypothetical protein
MTRMEDFLSIQNYKFIVEYISHKVKSDHQIEIDITKYDDKIYYFMDKLQGMSEQNDKLNKHKANMFVANKILNFAKPDINKELQRQQTTIQRGFGLEQQISMQQKIALENVSTNNEIPQAHDSTISFKDQVETNQIYEKPQINNDIDPKQMYKDFDIDRQSMNKPFDPSAPIQYKADLMIERPKGYSVNEILNKVYGDQLIKNIYITIDSRDRNHDVFQNPNSYTVDLGAIYTDVYKVELITAEIPKGGYLIESYNNIIHFQETNNQVTSNTYYEAEIPVGNYTSAELLTKIASQMSAIGQSAYTVSLDSINRVKIESDLGGGDGIFNIIFKQGVEVYGIDELRSKYMPFTIARTIGFDCKNHTSLDTYTADNRIPLQSDDYVVLEIPEFKGIIDDPHGDGQNDFAKILLDCEQGDTAFYSNQLYVLQKTFNPRIELSKITVNFKVHGGYLYNFHGLEHSLTFRIQSLKQKIYSDIDVRTHLDRENQEAMEEHTAQMEEIII